jgi:hypothetical protein
VAITSVEPAGTPTFVLEILDGPQVVALARASTDVQILTVDPEVNAATWIGQLPTAPAQVVAASRAVCALLADEPGRSWLGRLGELSLALTIGERPAMLLQAATDLESLGLRVEHVDHFGTTIAVLLRPFAGEAVNAQPLCEQLVEMLVRALAEAYEAADSADTTLRDQALALARPPVNIKRTATPSPRSGGGSKRRPSSRSRRAMRHPLITTRRVLGRIKRRMTYGRVQ